MTRIAVLGDLSGHLAPFVQALGELGVDVAAARVPDDLVVVQVGDLVHKGPDSDTIVALVDRLLDANPGRYLQLLGNHEDQYLGGQRFYEHTPLAGGTIATLRRWRASGRLRVAAALRTASGESYLVTHAGLTRLNFLHHIGSEDAGQAAEVLNGLLETRPKVIHAFPPDLARLVVVDRARRHVSVTIGGQRFINVDHGFDERPPGQARLHPVVLDGELVSPH